MFNTEQQNILLRRLNPSRVEKRKQAGMNLSYLAQHDVRAHLIRIFGFGGFDLETLEAKLAFENEHDGKWDVGYQVTMRLTVKDEHGNPVCSYSETAVGTSTQGRRGEAHDMAMKTASSDAMKRCAINLGDQFGLSLYDNGSTNPIVRATLVGHNAHQTPEKAPLADEQPDPVSQEGSEQTTPALPAEVSEALTGIAFISDNRDRILAVAKFKTDHPEHLDHPCEVQGQQITVARYLDLVAAGQFTDKEETT